MDKNFEKYKKDLEKLIKTGTDLLVSLYYEEMPSYKEQIKKRLGTKEKIEKFKNGLPNFRSKYQTWYSESISVVRQLTPERKDDFSAYYKKPAKRKELSVENYSIEDYLEGIIARRGGEIVVGTDAVIRKYEQQLCILEASKARFESSLMEIKQLVQADIFDSELDTARELNDKGFIRAAGSIAGVVLEKHLHQVLTNHEVKISKKDPGISDLNDLLKANQIIDLTQWRFIQLLGDLRNLCDHKKSREPQKEDVTKLIEGVEETIKAIS